jgi:Helix-turn-helix domain
MTVPVRTDVRTVGCGLLRDRHARVRTLRLVAGTAGGLAYLEGNMAKDADSADTDLGRRIAEQRERASLTVAEAAARAGMSPDHLDYLESAASPNPTEATLTGRQLPARELDGGEGADLEVARRAVDRIPAVLGRLQERIQEAER